MIQKTVTQFPLGRKTFLLPGPAGPLEVLTSRPNDDNNLHPIVGVVCHPHPLYGGTLDNKVVYTTAKTFNDLGYLALRFNFRGVGASIGTYAHGIGETEDLLALLQWLTQVCPQYKIILAGFSFGAYVAACASKRWPIEYLFLLAPPIERFNFQALLPLTCPWAVIQGDEDEVVTPAVVFSWLASLDDSPKLIRLAGAGHFFTGKLAALRQALVDIVKQ